MIKRLPVGFYRIICVKCHLTQPFLSENPETDLLEQRWCPQEGSKGSFRGSTALLFELEDKVAQAAASVQNAQSQVMKIKQAELERWTVDRKS